MLSENIRWRFNPEKLSDAMVELKLTVEDVAKLIHVTPWTVRVWLRGPILPRLENFCDLCSVLRLHPMVLLTKIVTPNGGEQHEPCRNESVQSNPRGAGEVPSV